jgi:hypothetical protein
MASDSSTLNSTADVFFQAEPYRENTPPPIAIKRKNYLEKEVAHLGFLEQLTHFGSQFTKKEKEQFWQEQPDRKYKIGLLRSKDLDNIITIFSESFDFTKKLKSNIAGVQSFHNHDCDPRGVMLSEKDQLAARTLSLTPGEAAALAAEAAAAALAAKAAGP